MRREQGAGSMRHDVGRWEVLGQVCGPALPAFPDHLSLIRLHSAFGRVSAEHLMAMAKFAKFP